MKKLPHFSQRLRDVRAEAKMSQQELAERAGVARNTVARMESGNREPSWVMVQKLAHALGVPVGAFVDPAIIAPVAEAKRGRGRPRIYPESETPSAKKTRPGKKGQK